MSSYIISLFSKKQKKSVPLNPHGVSSDDFSEGDLEPEPSPKSVSSSSFSDSARLLNKTGKNKAVWDNRLDKAERYAKAFMSFAASTALSHVAPGTGGLPNIPEATKAASQAANIKTLLDEPCDNNQPEICQGLVTYVMAQKNRALSDALIKIVPGAGTLQTGANKLHALDKKIAKVAGEDRLAQGRLLVDHAKVCHVALALYAELVYGDLTSKSTFEKALKDVDNDLEWGASDEDPERAAVNKVHPKLKPVI